MKKILGVLLTISVLFSILPFGVAKADADTVAKDQQRRIMHHFVRCISLAGGRDSSNIDVKRDYDEPIDPIGGKIDNEKIVVGLDEDSTNGVNTCLDIIRKGVNILYGENTIADADDNDGRKVNVGSWLVEYLTGKTVSEIGETSSKKVNKDESGWKSKLNELKAKAEALSASLGAPSGPMKQRRFVPLLNMCYTASPTFTGPLGDDGFEVDTAGFKGFFYKKGGRNEVVGTHDGGSSLTIATFLKAGGQGSISRERTMFIGDIELGWRIGGNSTIAGGNWEFGSDFYPIGNDISPPGNVSYSGENEVVDCKFIKRDDVRGIIFDGQVEIANGVLGYKSTSVNFGESSTTQPVGGGTNSDDPESCESSMDGFTGLWVCPMLAGADKLITATEGIIAKKLQVNTEFTSNEGLHDAWTQLARISSGLLVIVALAMIVTTALGFDVVSSYTLKKMLPRIVIGAIGIWLSWALATTYIGFMNDLGRGISGIMFEPFKNLYTDVSSFSDVNLKYIAAHATADTDALTDNTAGLVFTGAFVLFIVSGGGLFAILSAGVTVIIAMLAGLFLLALREVVIVFLLVLAPIAVASWMLPNTNKVWKLWSGMFNKLLLLYPLFMGAFTAGKIFALISANAARDTATSSGNNGVIEVLIPMIAYVSPFFFLPALFKLAGSTFSNITGMVNDKGKGLIDKSKGYLDKKQASSYGAMAKKSRETARQAQKSRDYANDLTSRSPLGSYRRFRAGGIMPGGRRDVLAQASAAARATADKELESSLSGDVGALKAVANGDFKRYRADETTKINNDTSLSAVQKTQKLKVLNESVDRAERLAGKHEGNRHSQAAALMQLANMGMAGEAEFKSVASAFAGDTTGTAGAVIGAAKAAARSKGSISTSAITYQDGKIGYVNSTGAFVPAGTPGADAAKEEAVAQIVKGLSSEGYASLSVDTTKPTGPEFRDPGVAKYFEKLSRAEQVKLLNDPSVRIPPSAVSAMHHSLEEAARVAAAAAGVLPPPIPAFTYDAVTKVWS